MHGVQFRGFQVLVSATCLYEARLVQSNEVGANAGKRDIF